MTTDITAPVAAHGAMLNQVPPAGLRTGPTTLSATPIPVPDLR